jgi:hypothetical protein
VGVLLLLISLLGLTFASMFTTLMLLAILILLVLMLVVMLLLVQPLLLILVEITTLMLNCIDFIGIMLARAMANRL